MVTDIVINIDQYTTFILDIDDNIWFTHFHEEDTFW